MRTPLTPGSVTVGVDGSPGSDAAVLWAAAYAVAHRRPLTIVHGAGAPVVTDFVTDLDEARKELRILGRRVTDHALGLAQKAGPGLGIDVHLELSDPRSLLTEAAAGAHLLVLGSRGRGAVLSLLLGSVSVALAAHAPCPVAVVRPAERDGNAPVVVGIDGTADSASALTFAFELASVERRPLEVVHAAGEAAWLFPTPESAAPAMVEEVAADWQLLLAESVAGYAEKFPDVAFSQQGRAGLGRRRTGRGLRERLDRRGRRPGPKRVHQAAARLGEPVSRGARALHHRGGPGFDVMTTTTRLSQSECRDLLVGGVVGRVAMATPVGPRIVPVNYSVHGDAIVFRTAPYSELSTYGWDNELAFEVDQLDFDKHQGWSVVAIGRAHVVDDPEEVQRIRREREPRPWATGRATSTSRCPGASSPASASATTGRVSRRCRCAALCDAVGMPPLTDVGPRLPADARSLLDAVVAISSDLDLHSVLDRIVVSACQMTGARYGALGVLGNSGGPGRLRDVRPHRRAARGDRRPAPRQGHPRPADRGAASAAAPAPAGRTPRPTASRPGTRRWRRSSACRCGSGGRCSATST